MPKDVVADPVDDTQPVKVWDVPEELMSNIEAELGKPVDRAQQVDVQNVSFDTTPIALNTKPEIVQTSSGPMIVRRRATRTTLYRADGQEVHPPAVARQKYLNKRREGKPVFYERPPAELPDPEQVCPYCFKPFRPSTQLEKSSNQPRTRNSNPKVQALVDKLIAQTDKSLNDVDFKLADHILKRHKAIALFTGDPLATRYIDATQRLAR